MVHSRERLMRSTNGSRNWMSFISVWSEANERFLKRDAAIGNQRRLRCGITMSGASWVNPTGIARTGTGSDVSDAKCTSAASSKT